MSAALLQHGPPTLARKTLDTEAICPGTRVHQATATKSGEESMRLCRATAPLKVKWPVVAWRGCGKEVHTGDLASMGIAHPWPKVDEISATLFDVGLGNVLLIFF